MGRRGLLEIVFNMSGSIFQNVVDFWMYVRKTGAFCLGALELLCGSVRDQLWALKILLDIGPTRADIRTLARHRIQTFLGLPGTILFGKRCKTIAGISSETPEYFSSL